MCVRGPVSPTMRSRPDGGRDEGSSVAEAGGGPRGKAAARDLALVLWSCRHLGFWLLTGHC